MKGKRKEKKKDKEEIKNKNQVGNRNKRLVMPHDDSEILLIRNKPL